MGENDSGDKTAIRPPAAAAEKTAGLALVTGPAAKHAPRSSCPIVGIGASAGGLKALVELFESLPAATGLAYVVIQHLDASSASALAEILSRATAMPVTEVKNNTVAEPNHVYVITPGTELTVARGVLVVEQQKTGERRRTPVDSLLESLALDKGSKAIGVILSGTGADGSQGLKEIKAVGGITFAQAPQSAEYDGMPRSAMAASAVDFILPPAEIAAELSRLSKSRIITGPTPEAAELFPDGADALNRIMALLRKDSGINFAEYKPLTVKRRIQRRMVLLRMDKLDDYVAYLRQNGPELTALWQDLLINVTRFFREPQAFEILKNTVFPAIVGNIAASAPIRLWVPGCSTGEEAYSLAIALQEFLNDTAVSRRIQIFATDINETVIAKARAGIYPKTIAADVSPARLSRFFIAVDQGYQINQTIRDSCVFAKQDIGRDPPISRVDLVSCRNVMIYFGPALHKRVFPIFHYALNPKGFLMLGASESIGAFADLFDLVDKKHRIYAKKSVATPFAADFAAAEVAAGLQADAGDEPEAVGGSLHDVQKEADRIVLAKYAPSGVVINAKLDIIQFRGRTGAYLEPAAGMPSVNLLKMARDGLFVALRAAVGQAKQDNVPVKKDNLQILRNGQSLLVNVEVVPINGPFQPGEYFLILFRDAAAQPAPDSAPRAGAPAPADRQPGEAADEVARLKQEVAATKEYLQSIVDRHEATNEDLRYANEEVQSSNEELQSMNEELETAKEELQSTNEELMTLNEELGTRNTELSQVNNDMLNLLRSINLPVLILSSDLRIKRFNSVAEKVFNLIAADVGRPIGNIKPNIDIPDLEQASLDVIESLVAKEQEVQDRWGHWYLCRSDPTGPPTAKSTASSSPSPTSTPSSKA